MPKARPKPRPSTQRAQAAKPAKPTKTTKPRRRAKAAKGKRPTEAQRQQVDVLLDEAIGKLGKLVGNLGYSPVQGMYPMPVPSGHLAVCDLTALPGPRSRGPQRRAGPKGRRLTYGHVLAVAKADLTLLVFASIGDVDQWALTPDVDGKAVRGQPLARIHPRSGFLAVGDVAAIAALAKPGPPVVHARKPAWPVESVRNDWAEAGLTLPPRAQVLAELAAPTGLWHGTFGGVPLAILHVGHKAPVWLRKGLGTDGSQKSLYMTVLKDHALADPVLRKINERDVARERRRKAREARLASA